jgi:hypothetical protein
MSPYTIRRTIEATLALVLIGPLIGQELHCYRPGSVSYYGFYASDFADVPFTYGGPYLDGSKTVTQMANLTFVRDKTAQGIINLLLAAEARSQKAIVALDSYIFDGATAQPYPDWQNRMDTLFLGGIDPATGQFTPGIFFVQPAFQLYQTTVAAFYLQDEPYLNGYLRRVPAQTILTNANTVIVRLKSYYGYGPANTPIAQIYSVPELAPDTLLPGYIPGAWKNIWNQHAIMIPTGVTWVGFDCYDSWSACGVSPTVLPINVGTITDSRGPGSGLAPQDSWYKRLKLLTNQNHDYFYPNGRLRSILVPPSSVGVGRDEAAISTWAQYYAYAAQDDEAVIGVFNWLWGNYTDPANPALTQIGLANLSSSTRQAFQSVAACLLRAQ